MASSYPPDESRASLFLRNSDRARKDGNDSLGKGDLDGAISAYKQAAACVTVAVQSGADVSSEAVISAGCAACSNLSLALLRSGDSAGALSAADAALAYSAVNEKALWRRAAALRDVLRKRSSAASADSGDGEARAVSIDDVVAAVRTLLSSHPKNSEGLGLLDELLGKGQSTDGAQAAQADGDAPTKSWQQFTGAEPGRNPPPPPAVKSAGRRHSGERATSSAIPGLSPAKFKAALSGLYADTPGYDDAMRDIRPVPALFSTDWWRDLCCCARRAQKKGE